MLRTNASTQTPLVHSRPPLHTDPTSALTTGSAVILAEIRRAERRVLAMLGAFRETDGKGGPAGGLSVRLGGVDQQQQGDADNDLFDDLRRPRLLRELLPIHLLDLHMGYGDDDSSDDEDEEGDEAHRSHNHHARHAARSRRNNTDNPSNRRHSAAAEGEDADEEAMGFAPVGRTAALNGSIMGKNGSSTTATSTCTSAAANRTVRINDPATDASSANRPSGVLSLVQRASERIRQQQGMGGGASEGTADTSRNTPTAGGMGNNNTATNTHPSVLRSTKRSNTAATNADGTTITTLFEPSSYHCDDAAIRSYAAVRVSRIMQECERRIAEQLELIRSHHETQVMGAAGAARAETQREVLSKVYQQQQQQQQQQMQITMGPQNHHHYSHQHPQQQGPTTPTNASLTNISSVQPTPQQQQQPPHAQREGVGAPTTPTPIREAVGQHHIHQGDGSRLSMTSPTARTPIGEHRSLNGSVIMMGGSGGGEGDHTRRPLSINAESQPQPTAQGGYYPQHAHKPHPHPSGASRSAAVNSAWEQLESLQRTSAPPTPNMAMGGARGVGAGGGGGGMAPMMTPPSSAPSVVAMRGVGGGIPSDPMGAIPRPFHTNNGQVYTPAFAHPQQQGHYYADEGRHQPNRHHHQQQPPYQPSPQPMMTSTRARGYMAHLERVMSTGEDEYAGHQPGYDRGDRRW